MHEHSKHKITVCVSCRYQEQDWRSGFELLKRLRAAVAAATDIVGDDFEISGVACMAGCSRPCTIAHHASRKATYLFGDIDPEEHIDDLIAFAKQYRDLGDGWSSSTQRPDGLRGKTLVRMPSAFVVAGPDKPLTH